MKRAIIRAFKSFVKHEKQNFAENMWMNFVNDTLFDGKAKTSPSVADIVYGTIKGMFRYYKAFGANTKKQIQFKFSSYGMSTQGFESYFEKGKIPASDQDLRTLSKYLSGGFDDDSDDSDDSMDQYWQSEAEQRQEELESEIFMNLQNLRRVNSQLRIQMLTGGGTVDLNQLKSMF